MTRAIEVWLQAALADADRRGLPDLKPLLETLARSTDALRAADSEHRLAIEATRPRGSRDA
jgi:hypothetical protein